MAYDVTGTLQVVASALEATGEFDSVSIGEPKSPPSEGFAAAVYMDASRVVRVMLGDPAPTEEVHVVMVRAMRNMLAEPTEGVETELGRRVSLAVAQMLTDADLNSEVRNVDVAGEHGRALETAWGYVDVGGVMYRAADTRIAVIVDGSAQVST